MRQFITDILAHRAFFVNLLYSEDRVTFSCKVLELWGTTPNPTVTPRERRSNGESTVRVMSAISHRMKKTVTLATRSASAATPVSYGMPSWCEVSKQVSNVHPAKQQTNKQTPINRWVTSGQLVNAQLVKVQGSVGITCLLHTSRADPPSPLRPHTPPPSPRPG